MPLEQFLPYAAQAQEAAKAGGSISDPAESIGYFFISCLPWLSYSALIQPVPMPADSNPRITWGKYETHGQDTILPVSLLAHHGLVDGKHIADFISSWKSGFHDRVWKRTSRFIREGRPLGWPPLHTYALWMI